MSGTGLVAEKVFPMDWAVFAVLVFISACTGAVYKPGPWYDGLAKPRWTPPNWLFPVVWTVLYVLIAWAGVLAWRAGAVWALVFWGAQWLFNSAWSWLFFGRKRMDLGLLDVSLLWLSVLAFIVAVAPMSALAATLFVPYLAWVSAAALLNLSVLRLNPLARSAEAAIRPFQAKK
jgi:tryptophan-rich sensory protein